MSRYKKLLLSTISVFVSIFFLISIPGCNNSENIETSSDVSVENGLNPSAKLKLWFTMNTAENNEMIKIADEFKQETGITVEVLDSNFFTIRQNFPNSANSSQKPDIVYIQSADLGLLAENGFLRPIDWLSDDIRDRFFDIGFDAMSYKGINYGAGYSIDAYGIVYNKDIIDEIPSSWSDYFLKARQLTVKNGKDITLFGTQIAPNNFWFIYPLIKNEGGYFFNRNSDGSYNPDDIGISNEGTIKAVNKLLALKSDGLTTQSYTEIDSNISARFSNGQVAMFIYGLWDAAIYKSKGVNYGIVPLPDNDDGTPSKGLSTVQGFVLNKFSDWPDESDAFLQFILRDENQLRLYKAGNGNDQKTGARNTCSIYVSESEYVKQSEVLSSLIEVSLLSEVFPVNPEAVILWNYSTTALNAIFFNNAPVEEKLNELQNAIEADIDEMRG